MAPKSQHALRTPERGHGLSIPAQRGQEIPAQREPLEEGGFPVSVTSLLRREGIRVPHAADGPLQPRTHHLRAAEQLERWMDGVIIRRAGAAAGALVAAASVLGAAVLTDASGGGLTPEVTIPGAPGDGRVDALPGLALLGPMTPGSADVVSLAAFQPADCTLPGTCVLGGVSGLPGGVPGIVPGGPGGLPVTSGGGYGPGTQVLSTVTSPVKDLTDTVGGLLPAPVGGVVTGFGGAVDAAGGAVGGIVDSAAGPLSGPVGTVAAPVTGAAKKVTGAVGGTVDKVAEPVGNATKPITDTVGKVAGPVVSLVDGNDERRDPALSTISGGGQGGSLVGSIGKTASGLLGGG